MALDGTLTEVSKQDVADRERMIVDLQGPSSYDQAGGGEDLLASLSLRTGGLLIETAEGRALDPANGYAKWDAVAGLLKLYTAADVEQANAFDASAFTYRLTVFGR